MTYRVTCTRLKKSICDLELQKNIVGLERISVTQSDPAWLGAWGGDRGGEKGRRRSGIGEAGGEQSNEDGGGVADP